MNYVIYGMHKHQTNTINVSKYDNKHLNISTIFLQNYINKYEILNRNTSCLSIYSTKPSFLYERNVLNPPFCLRWYGTSVDINVD